MLQRGGFWLVGVVVVVACGGPREAPLSDSGGASTADAQSGGPLDGYWPAGNCPGATDIANVGTLTRQHAFVPHLVRAGARTGMLWSGATATTFEIKFAWLDDAMQVVPDTTVVVSPDDGAFSAFGRIAWSGSELGVVYEDARHGDQHRDVYFARLDASGRPIAGSEIELSAGAESDNVMVAWDPVDAQWGVAWQEWPEGTGHGRAWFARLDAHGALSAGSQITLEDPGNVILNPQNDGPLIWTGSHWALAWFSSSATVISEIPALGGTVHDIRLAEAPDSFDLGPSVVVRGSERPLTCDGQTNQDNVTSWHGSELDIVYTAWDPSGNNTVSGPEVNDLRVLRVPGGGVQ